MVTSRLLLIRPTGRANNRRLLLSTLTPTPAPKPVLPNANLAVVSRRQWNRLYQPPPRKPRNRDTSLDDKPWPISMQILGYVGGGLAVPYCVAWIVATNPTARDAAPPAVVPYLRQWFGHEEDHAISYADWKEQEGDAQLEIPKRLDNEPSFQERTEQAALEELVQGPHPVSTRLRVFLEGGFNVGEIVDLPGTTPANATTLLGILMKDRSRTIEEDSVSHVTVEFADLKEEERDDAKDEILVEVFPEEEERSSLNAQMKRLLQTTSIFSAWHVFPELMVQQQQQQQRRETTTAAGPDEIRIRQLEFEIGRLEYEVEQLEQQQRDVTTTRSFDDIQDDLTRRKAERSRHKGELWRLRWKKRLSFF